MTHWPPNIAELALSIQYAERQLAVDAVEIRQHVDRLNWLFVRRNQLRQQIARDRIRIAEAERTAVAES